MVAGATPWEFKSPPAHLLKNADICVNLKMLYYKKMKSFALSQEVGLKGTLSTFFLALVTLEIIIYGFGGVFIILAFPIIALKFILIIINFLKKRFVISSIIALLISAFNFLTVSLVDEIFEFLPTEIHRKIVEYYEWIFFSYEMRFIFLFLFALAFYKFFFKERKLLSEAV